MSSPKSAGTSPSPAPSSVGGGNVSKFGTVIPNRVFVGGISGNTSEQDLLELFSRYGNVKSTKVINDRSGLSKGYGFVTFETEEEARRLTQEADNIMLKDRKLNIAPAVKKQVTDYAGIMKAYSPRLEAGPVYLSPATAAAYYQQQVLAAANGAQSQDPALAAQQAVAMSHSYPQQLQQAAMLQSHQAQQAAALAAAAASNGTSSAAATQPQYAQPQTTHAGAFVYPHMYYPHYQQIAAEQQRQLYHQHVAAAQQQHNTTPQAAQQQQLYQQQVAAAQQQQWGQQQQQQQWRWLQQAPTHPAYAAAAQQAALAQAAAQQGSQQQSSTGGGVGYITGESLYAAQQSQQYLMQDPTY